MLESTLSENEVYAWELFLDDWFFVGAMGLLLFEMIRLTIKKETSWAIIADTVANFITLAAFIGITALLSAFYISIFYFFYEYVSITQLPINLWTISACIILADIAYYWEHRAMHRFGIAWATHTVHHSSPYFNISVAYRFGPMDSIIPVFFHIPLAMLGFNPIVIFFAEVVVQLYQTALHTEIIGKLPRRIESVMNTPSHHRVHHGSNAQYLDKNYAGIFIIWDKLFGTFEEEQEKVIYGVLPAIESANPVYIFLHGITGLFAKIYHAKRWRDKFAYLYQPPSWKPEQHLPRD